MKNKLAKRAVACKGCAMTKMETTTRKVAEELFSIAPGDGLEEKYKTKSRKKKHESTTYVTSVLK